MDLETILLEFALGFTSLSQKTDPIEVTLALNKYIREFAEKTYTKTGLINSIQTSY